MDEKQQQEELEELKQALQQVHDKRKALEERLLAAFLD